MNRREEPAELAELEMAIELFLEFLGDCSARRVDEEMASELSRVQHVGGTILIAYDRRARALRVVDPIPPEVWRRMER